ncbi:MAG: hypothetical protein EPN26_13695 [Rhodospirillales bacterium]|nr:MAG: hypothetical protein EPN26_13695 [Rhodospirillales bacterium]
MRKVLVTLALGDKHRQVFARVRPTWQAYAEKHGYDLVVYESPLDPNDPRSPAWQKLLILDQPETRMAERVVWMDCDIAINVLKAPDLADGVPVQKVGAVALETSFPPAWAKLLAQDVPDMSQALAHREGKPEPALQSRSDYYAAYGLKDPGDAVNTGVLVLSPNHHRDLFRELYKLKGDPDPLNQYEQPYLSHALVERGLLHPLDRRFNRLWFDEMCALYPFLLYQDPKDPGWESLVHLCVQAAYTNAFALHFAGCVQFLGYWRNDILDWRQFTRLFGQRSGS